ncbi:hypothetical protein CesoFtcFv8_024900 [Champsocephalus esox]|uniref:Uncharacterized protein n=2 Tax=Champsocephalus TaxID=52236 RepID=A0AAN8C9K4_CHAGU|nr:hypothetical protein CesoFtcFv8_024900 [Champsocephalus esox]KAK5898350.1 hypothetical protein CgunFtcFv8_015774 [Champsocephalus gunnari]
MPPDTLRNKAQCFSAATLSIQCQALPASCLKAALRAGVTHHLVSVSRSQYEREGGRKGETWEKRLPPAVLYRCRKPMFILTNIDYLVLKK